MSYILDTNIISALINRSSERVTNKFRYLLVRSVMFISCVTYFEVKGGLLAKNATRKLEIFNDLCSTKVGILYLEDQKILDRASQIYAELKLAGTPVGTPDILIAATAIERNLILVSHDRDMLRIRGAIVEDWLAPEE